jgi:Tol biopolymer transport system component
MGINNENSDTADPALSKDERLIVYSRRQGGGNYELYYATRATATDGFNQPAKIPDVNGGADDADPMLSDDGCELYFASNRDADGKYHLFRARTMR